MYRAERIVECFSGSVKTTGRVLWAVVQGDGWVVAEMYEPNAERNAKLICDLLNGSPVSAGSGSVTTPQETP